MMAPDDQKNRKWERYGCLLPCRVIPQDRSDTSVSGRIINIGRGGILIEADFSFTPGDRLSIVARSDDDLDRFDLEHEIHGTVRWGHLDTTSLMGLYYVGIEFDQLLPLKQAADRHN